MPGLNALWPCPFKGVTDSRREPYYQSHGCKAIEDRKPLLPSKKGKFTEQDIDDYIGLPEKVRYPQIVMTATAQRPIYIAKLNE